MAIVDLATSSFILFTVIVREKIEVVEDVCASPAKYLKELTRVFKKSRKFRRLGNVFERRSQSLQKCIIIPAFMCFMMLTRSVNVRVHVNTGAKGNLLTAERDLKILQFESVSNTPFTLG